MPSGDDVRLIPPAYAKAYVRRNKNDAADAAAICEAVSRPSMRFVTIKTAEQQAAAGIHKVRELLMKQRTFDKGMLRIDFHDSSICLRRLLVTFQAVKGTAAPKPRMRQVRL